MLSKINLFAKIRITEILKQGAINPSEAVKLLSFCERLDEIIKPFRDKAYEELCQKLANLLHEDPIPANVQNYE